VDILKGLVSNHINHPGSTQLKSPHMPTLQRSFKKMSKAPPFQGVGANSYFLGLIPGPETMDGDWDVDGPNVIRRMEPRTMLEWMADAQRPQPVMADGLDDDA
jgi:hypothetical protein